MQRFWLYACECDGYVRIVDFKERVVSVKALRSIELPACVCFVAVCESNGN